MAILARAFVDVVGLRVENGIRINDLSGGGVTALTGMTRSKVR